MNDRSLFSQVACIALVLCLCANLISIFGAQDLRSSGGDLRGGVTAFMAQDIVGGAAIVFKRGARIRDLTGGAAKTAMKTTRTLARRLNVSVNVQVASDRGRGTRSARDNATVAVSTSHTAIAEAVEALIYNNLGAAYFNAGQFNEAIEAFKHAVRLSPDAEAYYNLGNAYNGAALYKEAADAFAQAAKLKPEWAEAHNSLGETFITLGREAEAIEAYRTVARLKPNEAETFSILAYLYGKQEKYPEAVER